jgi:hypothetical protein
MANTSQRRWREIPKDELDAVKVSQSGKPLLMTKEERSAANIAKRNRLLQRRRNALKSK